MLKILYAPDPILKDTSSPIENFGENIQELIQKMFKTMYHANGVGLAAPQVGQNLRLFVMDEGVKDEKNSDPIAMINPKILKKERDLSLYEEGCLSFPGHYAEIERPNTIEVEYINENKEQIKKKFSGYQSRIIQHEIDHLDGILFVDYLSKLKRDIIVKKMIKYKKSNNI